MPLLDKAPKSFDDYASAGGGRGLEIALRAAPEAVIDEVAKSGLRGRGGAGFPTGEKWRSIRATGTGTRFAVCNGAEGEPATFKDRHLLRTNPYQVLEGLAIAAYAVGAERCYVGLKETFTRGGPGGRPRAAGDAGRPTRSAASRSSSCPARTSTCSGRRPGWRRSSRVARPCRGWLARSCSGCSPHRRTTTRRSSTTSRRWPTSPTSWPTAPTGSDRAARRPPRDDGLHGLRRRPAGGGVRAAARHAAPLSGGGLRGRPAGGQVAQGALPRRLEHGHRSRASWTCRWTSTRCGRWHRPGSRRASRCSTTAPAWCGPRYLYSRFLWVESCGQCPACKFGTGEVTRRCGAIESGAVRTRTSSSILMRARGSTDGQKCALPTGESLLMQSSCRCSAKEFRAHLGRVCPLPRDLVFHKIIDWDAATSGSSTTTATRKAA